MKNLLDVKFEDFVEDFNLQGNSEDINQRKFINYHFFSQFQPGRLDTDFDLLEEICVDSPYFSQIHGAFFLLNEQILSETQDIDDILQRDQKGLLELYFLTLGNVECFAQQLENLFKNLDVMETSEEWLDILACAMSQKVVRRWKDNPVLHVVSYSKSRNVEIKFSDKFSSFFSDIDIIKLNERSLQDIVNSNENSYQVEITANSPLIISGGNERLYSAFVICMSPQELLKLMLTSEGLLRRNIFDDNVRDSQGDSTVNQEILSTLKNYPERFVLYNNGITIVCKEASIKGGKYVLVNPQIVNGCQTCNMVYQAYRKGMSLDKVQIIVKIVGSNKEDVTQGIVRGANRQNIVYEEAFETIRVFHKNLEKYFENNQINGYEKIYYERRSRQYVNHLQIKPQQKISFRGLIQSMTALFLNHVEDSHRHEYTLLKKYKDSLFFETHSCLPYYLAAFLYLNVDILFRNGVLPKTLSRYKMHIMLLVKEMKGGSSPELSSKRIDKYCNQLLVGLENGKLKQSAIEACEKFEDIRTKWIRTKGEQYRFGIKDSAEFRNFLMKEVHGVADECDTERLYTGYVMNVNLDTHNNLFGFIEHTPNNIFFHEFDNPDMNQSYIGKKVSYKIALDGDKERAINVKIVEV